MDRCGTAGAPDAGAVVRLAAAIGIFVFYRLIRYRSMHWHRLCSLPIHWLCNWSHKLAADVQCIAAGWLFLCSGNTVSGPFMSAINIATVGGIIVASPIFFWELWRFINWPSPGKKFAMHGEASCTASLFHRGRLGYFLLAPFTFNFLANFTLGTVALTNTCPRSMTTRHSLNNIILGCTLRAAPYSATYCKIDLSPPVSRNGITANMPLWIILIIAAIINFSPDWSSPTIVLLLPLYEISVVIVARIDKQKGLGRKGMELIQ